MFARVIRASMGVAVCVAGAGMLAGRPAQAGSVIGVNVEDYILMYEGGSSGSQLSVNNFGTTGIWTGDLGIAGVGQLAATGPGTVNGNINFAAPNTGQASISNTTVNGTVNYNVGAVQTIMSNLNSLSSTLGAQAGLGTAIAINTSSDHPNTNPAGRPQPSRKYA